MSNNDTIELRRQFAEKFLSSPQEYEYPILNGTMADLIEEFDSELAVAKRRWPSIDTAREWAEMDRWLCDRGCTE